MDRYASGDDAAFPELYGLLAPRLGSFLFRRTRCAAKTADLVQQTFLQMHAGRGRFARGQSVSAWAYAIARRLLIDDVRRNRREMPVALEEDDGTRVTPPGEMPDRIAANHRLARRAEDELAHVPAANRTALALVHRDGLTATEAAAVLGTTAMAVRLRVHRACEALRAVLGGHVHEELRG